MRMVDLGRPEIYVIFIMTLCELKTQQTAITLLSDIVSFKSHAETRQSNLD